MNQNRDNFSESLKRRLAERVGYVCSNPMCGRATTGPHSAPGKSIRIGRAAHISAAAAGGPRYNPAQTPEQRASIANGIWLCANCADLIDKDAESFTQGLLNEWKSLAEGKALHAIAAKEGSVLSTLSDETRQRAANLINEGNDLLSGEEGGTRFMGKRSKATLNKIWRVIKELERFAPQLREVFELKACFMLAAGRITEAHEIAIRIHDPGAPSTLILEANCLRRLGRDLECIPLLKEAAKCYFLRATALYNLGLVYDELKNPVEAEKCYLEATQLDPEYGTPHIRLAQIERGKGDLARATHHASIAYRLQPTDETILIRFALLLLEQGKINASIALLGQNGLRDFPNSSDMHSRLGHALGRVGMLAEGEHHLRQAIALDPRNGAAWVDLSINLAIQGRATEFLKEIDIAEQHGYFDAEKTATMRQAAAEIIERSKLSTSD